MRCATLWRAATQRCATPSPGSPKTSNLWLEPSAGNADHVMRAFHEFGLPLIVVTPDDFAGEGLQYMIGRAPVLFDFLTTLPEFDFAECWEARFTDTDEGFPIHYLSKAHLIAAKEAAGRPQNIADLDEIRRAEED